MLPSLPIYVNILKPVALIENISGGSSDQGQVCSVLLRNVTVPVPMAQM